MDIKGKLVIISGAASGLGKETAIQLASKGAKLALLDNNHEKLDALNKEVQGYAVICDVRNNDELQNAIKDILNHFHSSIQCAVSCAGIAPAARIVSSSGVHSLELFQQVIDVNLVGTFNLIRATTESMIGAEPNQDGERGVYILTASIAAFEGQIGQAAYAASKGGIVGMTLPLARDFARNGVRVMTIAPGFMETPMMSGFTQKVQEALQNQMVFPKRFGKPSEFSSMVEEIIRNPLLNGSVIRLDGAVRMSS